MGKAKNGQIGYHVTGGEKAVYDALVAAWEEFRKLPGQHPDEQNEFRAAIHAAQGLLTTRVCRRLFPRDWPTYPQVRKTQ